MNVFTGSESLTAYEKAKIKRQKRCERNQRIANLPIMRDRHIFVGTVSDSYHISDDGNTIEQLPYHCSFAKPGEAYTLLGDESSIKLAVLGKR